MFGLKLKRSAISKNNRHAHTRLGFEQLEDRAVPAIIFDQTYNWDGMASVQVTVDDDASGYAGKYLWNYRVTNNAYTEGGGIGMFVVSVGEPDEVDDLGTTSSLRGFVGMLMGESDLVSWQPETEFASPIEIGQSADFWFTTSPTAIVERTGFVSDLWFAGGAGGGVAAPAAIVVDIGYDVAVNQDLEASEGVGVLANYGLSSPVLDYIMLPGANATYNPGTAITTAGGGTLTVYSDGSFTFDPGQAGADTFLFVFSDGIASHLGTVTLSVGGSGSNFGPSELVASPSGTLKYERASTGFTDDFIVHDVPYHAVSNGVTGIIELTYQTFVGELAHVEDVATVSLPVSDFVPELQSSLWSFTFADGQELVTHIVKVRQAIDIVTTDMQAALGTNYSSSVIKGKIDRWFKGNGTGSAHMAPTQVQVGTILGVYQFVADDLDSRNISYQNGRHDPFYDGLYGYNDGSGDIVIGPEYWAQGVTSADRFGTIIHELTHTNPPGTMDGRSDNAYFLNPYSLNGNNSVVWRWNGAPTTVTTAELVNNADSYAGLLTQYYFLGPP